MPTFNNRLNYLMPLHRRSERDRRGNVHLLHGKKIRALRVRRPTAVAKLAKRLSIPPAEQPLCVVTLPDGRLFSTKAWTAGERGPPPNDTSISVCGCPVGTTVEVIK